jgi:predicted ATPase
MFIGTHRVVGPDNTAVWGVKAAVSPDHLTAIQLDALRVDVVCEIASSLLGREEDDVKPLAEVIHRKTGGNAFFAVQFLRLLCERKQLFFYSMYTYRWEWDLERIVEETEVADNIVDIMSGRIRAMPVGLQQALEKAACLGSTRFDAEILLQLTRAYDMDDVDEKISCLEVEGLDEHKSLLELEALLAIAVHEGLLEKLASRKYKFSHDRVKESVHALLPEGDEKLRLHLHIGRQLQRKNKVLAEAGAQESDPLVLLAVHHLNLGSKLIVDGDKKVELARMNDKAADLAFGKSSFFPAVDYLESGIALLDADSRWDQHYDLTLKMTTTLAHVQFCCGKHEASRRMIDEVLDHARSLDDKLGVYHTLIRSLCQHEEQDAATEVTLSVLDQLGVHLPRRCLSFHIIRNIARTRRQLRRLSDEDLLGLPAITDEYSVAAWGFLALLGEIAAVAGNKNYHVLAGLQAISMMMTHGHYKSTGLALAYVGFNFHVFGDFDAAYRYAKLALHMANEGKDAVLDARTVSICHYYMVHWKKLYQDCIEPVVRALKSAMQNGDVAYTFYLIVGYSDMYYHSGLRLDPLEQDMKRYMEVLDDYGQVYFLNIYRPHVQLVLNLMGKSDNPLVLTGSVMNEEECRVAWKKTRNVQAEQSLYVCRMFLAYYFDDLPTAEKMSSKLAGPMEFGYSAWFAPRTMMQGMIAFALFKSTRRRRYRRWGLASMRKIESFLRGGNVNCHPMLLLLRAEHATIDGRKRDDVQRAFDDAIIVSGRLGCLHNQALGNERAGVYFLKQKDTMWAATYLTRAFELYAGWGARAKALQLQEKFKHLIDNSKRRSVGSMLMARPRLDDMVFLSSTQLLQID